MWNIDLQNFERFAEENPIVHITVKDSPSAVAVDAAKVAFSQNVFNVHQLNKLLRRFNASNSFHLHVFIYI